MIAISSMRPIVVGLQVVLTFGAAQAAGVLAAVNDQQQQTAKAQAAISRADHDFAAQAARSLDEGTPKALLDPLVAEEAQLKARPLPAAGFMIDRQRIDAMTRRVAALKALTGRVVGAETQTEVQMHQLLVDAVKAMRDHVQPARDAGVDPAEFTSFADDIEKNNQGLSTPVDTQKVIDSVKAKDASLLQATSDRVAANEALQAAKDNANYWLQQARASLAADKAIPVLKVSALDADIAALAARLTPTAALAEFQAVGDGLRTDATTLGAILNTRQSSYDLLAQTRQHLQWAKEAGNDTAADGAQLDAAAKTLDLAGDLPALKAAHDAIQAIKNNIDAKWYAAIYGHGKVIVVSIAKEEMMVLQDGVVMLDTIVTTGRPSLPTVTGIFHIFYKASPYRMVSPWPPSSQYYYPPTWMNWAMEFADGGYFIHDAPWRSHFGPGSDTENGGTHGCVNVPNQPMSWLYPWTDMGTTVIILHGDFGSPIT